MRVGRALMGSNYTDGPIKNLSSLSEDAGHMMLPNLKEKRLSRTALRTETQ